MDEGPSFLDRAEGLRREFGKLRERVGTPLAILAALVIGGALAWWRWEDIATKPGVAEIVAWFEQKPIARSKPGRLTIAIAHLEDDKNREHEKLLRDALENDFEGAETEPVDRTITPPDAETGQAAIAKAKDEASHLLRRSGADVLLWGKVVTLNGKSEMRLYWTTGGDLEGVKPNGLYPDSRETIAIPPLFWDDLKQVLGVLVQSRIAAITRELTGHYSADRLTPLIAQVRKLLQARQGDWTPETEAAVRFALAGALGGYGDQTGNSDALGESIEIYRQVLATWTRERVPLDRARTQNNLGTALTTLGERENGAAAGGGGSLQCCVDGFRHSASELLHRCLSQKSGQGAGASGREKGLVPSVERFANTKQSV